MIGIRCERGSHRFFKRYGERFEDSEGKQIFLEFADEERAHLELLIREYRVAGRAAAPAARREAAQAQAAAAGDRLIRDRSPPPHDRVRRPADARRAGGARRRRRPHR